MRFGSLWCRPRPWGCLALCAVCQITPAWGAPESGAPTQAARTETRSEGSAGPTLTAPVRRVDAAPVPSTPAARAADAKTSPGPVTHQTGRPPKEPKATLPAGVPGQAPDRRARHRVAQGFTLEERAAAKDDPELRTLAEAEQTLFATPLKGIVPGWSWTGSALFDSGSTEVTNNGLPPGAPEFAPEARELERQLAMDAEWLRSLSMPDLPVRMDERVVKYLKFYRDSDKGRAIAHVWAKKAGRFAPALKAELAKAGLPQDLVWLSLIESGHNPSIKSPAGAVGLWQFMAASGRSYGLTIDRWVDERLDPARSTQAAIRFLGDLYQRFGNWELAMAAYNMGYAGMSRAITKFNTNDFWQLSRYEAGIPWETTLYVPKIFAIAIVMNNKKAFGIDDVVPDAPERFDTILVGPGQSLLELGRAGKLANGELLRLNPQYLAERTPPSSPEDAEAGGKKWLVRVPRGSAGKLGLDPAVAETAHDAYRTRFGDTPTAIAQGHATTDAELTRLNAIGPQERLKSGTLLLLPSTSVETRGQGRLVVVVAPGNFRYPTRRRVFYEVRAGDSLPAIAAAFGVTQTELVTWNTLDESARLQATMVLQLFVDKARSLETVRHLTEREVKLLVVGTAAFYDHHEALNGRVRFTITCKAGDTLGSIAKRYGMSIGSLERVNRRSRQDPVSEGERIVVYAERPGADQVRSETAALGAISAPHPELLPGQSGSKAVRPAGVPRASAALD